MKTSIVTASEANRSFSKLLRVVEQGEVVEITSHGRKVAVLKPVERETVSREQRVKALETLKSRLAEQAFKVVGPWTREEIYERNPWPLETPDERD